MSTNRTSVSLLDSDIAANDGKWVRLSSGAFVLATPSASDVAAIATSALDTDGTLAANSDAKVASQKATKTYVDAHAGGSLSYVSSVLSPSDVNLTNNEYVDIVSVSLSAGTWLLAANAACYRTGGVADYTAKIWDKSSSVVASANWRNISSGISMSGACSGIVVVASTTTYYLSIGCSNTSCVCVTTANPSAPTAPANQATRLIGIKIA